MGLRLVPPWSGSGGGEGSFEECDGDGGVDCFREECRLRRGMHMRRVMGWVVVWVRIFILVPLLGMCTVSKRVGGRILQRSSAYEPVSPPRSALRCMMGMWRWIDEDVRDNLGAIILVTRPFPLPTACGRTRGVVIIVVIASIRVRLGLWGDRDRYGRGPRGCWMPIAVMMGVV